MIARPRYRSPEASVLHAHAGDRLFRTPADAFGLRCCAECGVIFLSPLPAEFELAAYYPVQ